MNVRFKKLTETAKAPTRGSASAAGYDLYADAVMTDPGFQVAPDGNYKIVQIEPDTVVRICTGIAMEIPEGYFGAVYARSGLATKQGLRPANCVGVIDSDYRGEIIVALHNDSHVLQELILGERVAQIVIQPYLPVEFEEVDELDSTERGTGGFGSSGR